MGKRIQSLTKTSPLSFYVGGKDEKANVSAVLTEAAKRLGMKGRSEFLRKLATLGPEKIAALLDELRF